MPKYTTWCRHTSDWQHELNTYMESNVLGDGDLKKRVRSFIAALLENLKGRFPEDSIAVMDAADVFVHVKAASSGSPESRYKYSRNEVSNLAEHRTEYSVNKTEGVQYHPLPVQQYTGCFDITS